MAVGRGAAGAWRDRIGGAASPATGHPWPKCGSSLNARSNREKIEWLHDVSCGNCLDTYRSRKGALAEYGKELQRLGIAQADDETKNLVSLNVGVARVLDLTSARERRRFGVSLEVVTGDDGDDLESCWVVADLARFAGFDAILSPSAALPGARNLNLYIDGRAAHLRLTEGPGREPVNYSLGDS